MSENEKLMTEVEELKQRVHLLQHSKYGVYHYVEICLCKDLHIWRLEKELKHLQQWKELMIQQDSKCDWQSIGRKLNLPLVSDIRSMLEHAIDDLLAGNKQLTEEVRELNDQLNNTRAKLGNSTW